jgi:hypothetical protein
MPTFQRGQYVKIIAQPSAEARQIIEVRAGVAKPFICIPASAVESMPVAPATESYAEAEMREALPHEYSLKTLRQRAVDSAFSALQSFRRDVPQEKQFEAFGKVTERYLADSRGSDVAKALLNQTIEAVNQERKPWSAIPIDFMANPQLPTDGYELLTVTLLNVTLRYTAPAREAG